MLKKIAIVLVGALLLTSVASAVAAEGERNGARRGRDGNMRWRLAVQVYTFNRFTLFEAIDKSKQAGARFIEGYSWHKISKDHGDEKFDYEMSDKTMADVKNKLTDSGLRVVAYYFNDLGKDEAVSRKVFDFCRKMGIEIIVCEPDPKNVELCDKLAQEYKVKVAIHNHPKHPDHPDYQYWRPEGVMKVLEGKSRWIGACADNGHWVRSGLDPVESVKKYEGRLISMHLKDVNEVGAKAHDVPFGTGVVDLDELLGEVKRQGFSGVFCIEYEHNMENNLEDVRQCVEWFNQAKSKFVGKRGQKR